MWVFENDDTFFSVQWDPFVSRWLILRVARGEECWLLGHDLPKIAKYIGNFGNDEQLRLLKYQKKISKWTNGNKHLFFLYITKAFQRTTLENDNVFFLLLNVILEVLIPLQKQETITNKLHRPCSFFFSFSQLRDNKTEITSFSSAN